MDRNFKLIAVILLIAFVSAAQDELVDEKPIPAKDRIAETKTEHNKRMMKTVDARISQLKYAWRCEHKDGKMIRLPFFSNGETWSPYNMIETETLDLMKKQIEVLHITMTEKQQEEMNELKPVPEK